MDYNITYRQKDKGWQFIISYKDNMGKWKQKSKQGFKTKKDAKPAAEKMLKELKNTTKNVPVNNDLIKVTFNQLTTIYLDHITLYKEYHTVKSYKNCFSKFKDLNNKRIKEIKKHDIQSIVDKLLKEHLKYSTVKKYVGILNMFFIYVKDDLNLIFELPTVNIKIPKEKEYSNKIALTKKQLNKLLKELQDNKYYMVAFIAANTGMRLGEVLGLTWDSIDFKRSSITVNKQWKVLRTRKSGFGSLKSKNSYRTIPLSPNTLKELKNYKKNNPTDINNRVTPFNASSIDKYLNPKLKELAGITMHELRHTYATALISNGVDFKTAAKILGHTVEMTMKIYSHVTDDMMKKATIIIENIF
ncbi:integrase [Clostridium novyi B str. ATCC 27606]|uniref:Integrase n=1 Tax=Clostridium novyi B str. ATCC 27606 TaxID=1443123 RepID=A0AA40M685_CLONO|nr:site-specific integrase [Clostridium novyi]KEI16950.1 integrase [Clostridium novyi B str. ATCC 27606]